jgi:pyruvate-formate lyase-activating enzyme
MGRCRLCEKRSEKIAGELGLCRSCILDKPDQALPPAVHPHFHMADLPHTSREIADQCLEAARDEGLRRVRLGNVQLLA